jgi:transposase
MHRCYPTCSDQIPADEQIGSVTADGAYDTRKCHDAIADRGAHAVIPPRKNAKPWKTVTAGRSRETKPCGHRNTSAAPSGDDGADTTAGAASRRRCIV